MALAPPRAMSTGASWPRESPDEQGPARPAVGPVTVTGLLVVHDGATWLKECLDALVLQTRPPDRLVIIDTGSIDDSLQIAATHTRIRQVFGGVLTISAPRECTFGEAVRRAVGQQPAGSASSTAPTGYEWLWLLHDDSAAAPEALAHLLDATRRSPSVAVAGPKLTTWDDPSRLLELGQQVTRSGGRAGGPATGEPDQGQHDHRTDVLGVNTSGMLIRRDVFAALGGFDQAFGLFRDDLDLCWRAHLAGHRVVVAPKARIREAAASANGRRSPDLSADAARRRARRHGRQVALARCSPYAVPFLTLWIALASLLSAAVLLVVKQPRRAWEEFGDLGSLMTPWRPIAARWRSRGIHRVRRRDLRGLFASRRAGFRETLDTIADAVTLGSERSATARVGSAPSSETGPSDDGESTEVPTPGVTWRILRHPGFLAVLVAAALAVVTWRSLLGALIPGNGHGVAGGELLPVSAGASGLWHAWLDGWHGAGLGNAVESAPYLPVLAAGAWVLEHLPLVDTSTSSVAASIAWLLVGAMPLSAWTAYLGARVVTRAQWPRAWAALAWASLGTLTTAQAGGRLGAVVAHILLPLVAAGFVCATRRSTSLSVTVGAAAVLGVTGAFNPALGAVGALAALVMLVVGPGATRLRAAVLLLVPAVLVGPWVTQLVDDPLLLLTGPGLTVWQGAATPPWQLALLHPGGPGSYPALLSAPIVLAGVVAMLRRGVASRAMTVLAVLTVTGLALGVASPQVMIGLVPQGLAGAGFPITVWAGTGLDLAALALIAATILGFDGLPSRLSRSGFGWRQILVAPVAAAAVLGVVASLAVAGWFGVGEALTGQVPEIPAVAADQADGPLGSRLVILSIGPMNSEAGTIGYRLLGREPGQVVRDLPSAPVAVAPDPLLAAAVKIAVSDGDVASADVARDALADQGVGFVAFRGASTEPLVRRLDATAGMTRLGDNQGLILWRVLPRDNAVSSSRLRLADSHGAPLRSIPVTGDHGRTDVRVVRPAMPGAPAAGLRLVVAEPARWADQARVTFAGRELTAVAGGEQPAYELPPKDGQLTIAVAPTRPWWRWGQLGLLLVVLVLASPFGAARSRRTA
jgi:GT2 family glycosyltransferase